MARTTEIVGTVALVVVALAGCGTDEPTADTAPPSSTVDAAWSPSGTEIGLGLVVPEHAHLAGPVFRRPSRPVLDGAQPVGDEVEALLVFDREPFAVFDDLAAQVRALGPEIAGSGAACAWWRVTPDDVVGFRMTLLGPVDEAPEGEVSAVLCSASTTNREMSVALELDWGDERPGTVRVVASRHEVETDVGTFAHPAGPPDPAGPEALALLPDPAPPVQPAAGDLFGGRSNCLSTGPDQMRLPEGARLVATEGGIDGASVLATDDVEATMAALTGERRRQPDDQGFAPIEPLALADGTTIRTQEFAVGGGGGGCDLTSSPDGAYVLVRMHSD